MYNINLLSTVHLFIKIYLAWVLILKGAKQQTKCYFEEAKQFAFWSWKA